MQDFLKLCNSLSFSSRVGFKEHYNMLDLLKLCNIQLVSGRVERKALARFN